MKLVEAIKKLESSDIFEEFNAESKNSYLVHAFTMISKDVDSWQLGYYNKKTDKIVVFDVGSEISRAPEQEVFKQGRTVEPLNLAKIKIDFKEVLVIIKDLQEKKYSSETVTKKIVIIQNIDKKQVYNVTLITTNFNIINIKIDASTGNVLKRTTHSIMQLGKPMKE